MLSLFHRTPQETAIQNINAPSSSFNNVGHDQYNIGVAHIYQGFPPAHSASPPKPSQTPFIDAPIDNLSIHFTGRKRELALIEKAFERRRDIPLRCALHGNQGVGKSQLAYSWAKSTFAGKENAYIMWISSTSVEKLFQGFSRLLRFINHPDKSHPDQNARLEAARRWLEEVDTGNWLLIFDNVFPETVEFLRQHLPRVNGRGTIVLTTRTRDVAMAVTSTAGEQHEVIEVPLLSMAEGVELFCGHSESGRMDPFSAKVEAIVMAVGRLPLAIAHAAAYMNQSQCSLDNMLELYQGKHKIEAISWENTLSDYEHKSVAATFMSQLHDLDRHCPDAGKLLRVIAFFDPESIPLELLTTGAEAIVEAEKPPSRSSSIASLLSLIQSLRQPTRSPLQASLLTLIRSPVARQNAINHLQTRSLVAYHSASQSPTFRLHDLIQLVVLENTKSSGLHRELFEFAVQLACAAFRQIEDVSSPKWWPQCELLVPHIQSLTLRQSTSAKAKKVLLLANNTRGSYLCNRGRYVEAESLYENIIADRRQIFKQNGLDTLSVMADLAWVYQRRGRYADAEGLLKKVLKGYKTRLGSEHRKTLWTMYNLASVYHRQSRHNDAENLLKQTLCSQESQFGPEDHDTLWTMHWLAVVCKSQERYDEAESFLTPVLQARERLLGSEHHYTLDTKHALAHIYELQQQYDTAAALFQEIVHTRERDLGSQHPDTLLSMHSLARLYTIQNRYGDAENLLVPALAASERILGLSHPDTQGIVDQLARVYEHMGRLDDAVMMKQRILPPSS